MGVCSFFIVSLQVNLESRKLLYIFSVLFHSIREEFTKLMRNMVLLAEFPHFVKYLFFDRPLPIIDGVDCEFVSMFYKRRI